MPDFIIDVEAKITARPVNPKVGANQRGPYQRNMSVFSEKATVYYFGTVADLKTLLGNAVKVLSKQTVLGAAAPEVVTGAASSITATTATLNFTCLPNGVSTTMRTFHGLTPETVTTEITPGTATSADAGWISNTSSLTGLSANTNYYYRARATRAGYTVWGQLRRFKTLAT